MASVQVAVFSAKAYDRRFLSAALEAAAREAQTADTAAAPLARTELVFHDFMLSADTVPLARGAVAVCVFVNDVLSAAVLEALHGEGVRAVLLRCAGFNNVDLAAAERLGLFVASVPAYAPEAVAEFAVALLQTLNRRTHRAYNRVREGNFSLDGLLGMTLHGKTVGLVGTGRIGLAAARIFRGYGCRLLAFDAAAEAAAFRDECGGAYCADLATLLPQCDVVSLHCPLTAATRHLIDAAALAAMKPGALLVNTSRGGLVDTRAVLAALKSGHLGGVALDVYEFEGAGALFYNDHSGDIIDDDDLMRLTTFHNALVCGHQAFFTAEALAEISAATLVNLEQFLTGAACPNALVPGRVPDAAPVRI